MSKTIVITGAGSGLGRALARRFAGEGERCLLIGRTLSKVEAVAEEIGGNAKAYGCDVSDPSAVQRTFDAIGAECGTIDVLINNAAVYEPFFIKKATDEQIINPLMINAAGPIFCTRAALPMIPRGGMIISVTSESVEANFPMLSVYQASKAAAERFTKSMNEELREDGIRCVIVRAGAMMDEQMSLNADPETLKTFGELLVRRGLNMRERGVSHVGSITHVFRALIDLPPDMEVTSIHLGGRVPA